MFKKSANRPTMVVNLKRIQNGFKVVPNEGHSIFQIKRIIRTMYRPDLAPQTAGMEQNGLSIPSTIIQPPSHFTFPAFASWFELEEIHSIQKEAFPEFFQPQKQHLPFSFGTKNGKLYKYYRNTMMGMWLQNVKKHLSAAHCRRNLVGDVSLIVRIHGFLQNWGLINFPTREHNKGIQLKSAQRLTCYFCQEANSEKYYATSLGEDQIIFQLCQHCFEQKLYPKELRPQDFVQVLQKNYRQNKHKIMNQGQLTRLLELLGQANSTNKEKERQVWSQASKQFSQFSRDDLIYNFLRTPTVADMNANIFENNEDLVEEKQPEQPPSIFQDFQNPLQASIAIAYYRLKTYSDPKVQRIFKAGEQHAQVLSQIQEEKIEQLTKMLADVCFSKLQLKSIFIQEYQKLVQKCLQSQKSTVSNTLAECLKQNVRFIEATQQEDLQNGVQIKNQDN